MFRENGVHANVYKYSSIIRHFDNQNKPFRKIVLEKQDETKVFFKKLLFVTRDNVVTSKQQEFEKPVFDQQYPMTNRFIYSTFIFININRV